MSEKELRKRLRDEFGTELIWIEPGFGSSTGQPDLLLPLGRDDIPLELKVGDWKKKGLFIKMRPSQIRYHRLAAERKRKAAILVMEVGLSGLKVAAPAFWLIRGADCPRDGYVKTGSSFYIGYEDKLKDRLLSLLGEHSTFWGKHYG